MKQLISVLIILFNIRTFAMPKSSEYDKIVEDLFPKDISSLKSSSDKALTLKDGGLDYVYETADLDGTGASKYLVVLYRARETASQFTCKISVINLRDKTKKLSPATKLNMDGSIGSCSKIVLVDLDGDRKPEIFVNDSDGRGNYRPESIFRWDGTNLVEITPSGLVGGNKLSVLRNIDVSKYEINKKILIVDGPNSEVNYDTSTKTYVMEDNKIKLTGSFDFLKIVEKKEAPETIFYSIAQEGTYILTIKNISSHSRSVRAEITVNGSIVLRPQDFCATPQPKKSEKNKWSGDDDSDDNDEDHCKRCAPKSEVYAIVHLKIDNKISVKLNGSKNSQLQVTMVKK